MEFQENFKSGFVALLGRPNVGKSTLMNSLLKQKIASVSPRPQTTRRQQLGILTLDEAQVIFTDTPGIHFAKHKLGNYMNEEAVMALEDSDIIYFLVDGSVKPNEEDELISGLIRKVSNSVPKYLVLNKADRIGDETERTSMETRYTSLVPSAERIWVSAIQSGGIEELVQKTIADLPIHPPFFPPDQVTDLYERELAADLIREAALLILRDEIPHGIAVRIDEFSERENGVAYIEATIFVERSSQKGIVIGEGGRMIKRLGTTSRQSIEEMSGRKVFLRLRVKVRKNWRNDDKSLRLFGFRGKGDGL
jgi:GTP-binding protein Era